MEEIISELSSKPCICHLCKLTNGDHKQCEKVKIFFAKTNGDIKNEDLIDYFSFLPDNN